MIKYFSGFIKKSHFKKSKFPSLADIPIPVVSKYITLPKNTWYRLDILKDDKNLSTLVLTCKNSVVTLPSQIKVPSVPFITNFNGVNALKKFNTEINTSKLNNEESVFKFVYDKQCEKVIRESVLQIGLDLQTTARTTFVMGVNNTLVNVRYDRSYEGRKYTKIISSSDYIKLCNNIFTLIRSQIAFFNESPKSSDLAPIYNNIVIMYEFFRLLRGESFIEVRPIISSYQNELYNMEKTIYQDLKDVRNKLDVQDPQVKYYIDKAKQIFDIPV